MSEITGFNPAQVKTELEHFAEVLSACYDYYNEGLVDLFYGLSESWYSQQAVEFANNYEPRAIELLKKLKDEGSAIVEGVTNAYNTVAQAHGMSGDANAWNLFGGNLLVDNLEYVQGNSPIVAEKDGDIGMVVDTVANTLLPNFEDKMNKANEATLNLPDQISFYDPNGSQQTAYSTTIKKTASDLTELASAIKDAINTVITEEKETIIASKESAAGALGN